jgi:hypothetical protein
VTVPTIPAVLHDDVGVGVATGTGSALEVGVDGVGLGETDLTALRVFAGVFAGVFAFAFTVLAISNHSRPGKE